MPDIEELVKKASELGKALAAHPAVQAHFAAQRAVRQNKETQKLLQDYHAQLDRIRQLEDEQKPVEVSDKHLLKEYEGRMAGNEALKTLMRTQADYMAVMTRVNQAMEAPVAALGQPESSA